MFKHLYAPFLMKRWVRPLVVVLFFGWFCSSMAVMPSVEVGLDQEITMPDESFVLKYFEFLKVCICTRVGTRLCGNKVKTCVSPPADG